MSPRCFTAVTLETEKHLDAVVTELIHNELRTTARLVQKCTSVCPDTELVSLTDSVL